MTCPICRGSRMVCEEHPSTPWRECCGGAGMACECQANEIRLIRCINMAMGCLDPLSENPDERLAWHRLLDAIEGREPRGSGESAREELASEAQKLGLGYE